ncbi:type II toxin-antitoxin system RelE/ParE family toxin [Nostoc sp. 'Peltigera malacea cyanobiont' DB3992]|uniref:type II toxin-antitoxin system RelE/ParE family toxin n=1 Tax=Nostoc sp. 'Peltigera malacea cyanobiont' DB3992 TaxID=1206980 RepID=UPI000C04249C|nr:type II toxin-antitoxin system RelE/ParE family toxin [Nostoc sp. 'Peltigera malacea cyanobiont' DB3992]PHM08007.1 hypothetical protein CK516_23380 [Nostoc sp. 'Peltigera malacea cyanobiont' DB3992]
MNYRLVVKDRATQDLRHLGNYILVNANADVAVKFLNAAEVMFAQLVKTPGMGKVTQLEKLTSLSHSHSTTNSSCNSFISLSFTKNDI